jgi:hypothetical protein
VYFIWLLVKNESAGCLKFGKNSIPFLNETKVQGFRFKEEICVICGFLLRPAMRDYGGQAAVKAKA